MRIRRHIEWDVKKILVLFFFLGIIGGTLICNLMSDVIIKDLDVVNQFFLSGKSYGTSGREDIFWLVCRQRAMEIGGAWLLSLTTVSVQGFSLLSFYWGFSISTILSMITMEKGLMALPIYVMSMTPQWIVYLPIAFVLTLWAISPEKKPRLMALGCLMGAGAVGAVLEVFF